VLKQGLSKQTCVGRALHRNAAPAHRAPQRSRSCIARGRPPSQTAQLPRLPAPQTRRSPRPCHAPACHARRAGRTHTPWTGGPSATPALVRRTTAGTSRRRHHWSSRPYLSARPSSSRRPTPLPPLHRCRGRHLASHRLARLLATARVSSFPRTRSTTPSHTLPSVRPPPLAGTPSHRGWCRHPLPRAVSRAARPQLWAQTDPR
jgi:hypothetical protein